MPGPQLASTDETEQWGWPSRDRCLRAGLPTSVGKSTRTLALSY